MSDDNVIQFPRSERSERDEITEQIGKIAADNQATLRTLAVQGAQLEPLGFIAARIDALVDFLMAPESDERLRFELAYHTAVQEMLAQALEQLRVAKITSGTSGLVLPR